MVVNLNFKKDGKILYKSAGFAGYIGVMTAMKPVSCSKHDKIDLYKHVRLNYDASRLSCRV